MHIVNDLNHEDIVALRDILISAHSVVALTGAGISVPSGIPDFRSANGLYSTKYGEFEPETILSREFFKAHPDEFFKFYREKMIYEDAKPNAAHLLLAELEKRNMLTAVITQNIDGLHTAAGNKNVLELHGSVHRNFCTKCGKSYMGTDVVTKCDGVPTCECGGIIKPDVVLYGEFLNEKMWNEAFFAVENADVMLVIGTSLAVSTASHLFNAFYGDKRIFINKGNTIYDRKADIIFDYDCAAVASELLKIL